MLRSLDFPKSHSDPDGNDLENVQGGRAGSGDCRCIGIR